MTDSTSGTTGANATGSFEYLEMPVFQRATDLLNSGQLTEAGNLLHQAAAEAVAMDDAPAAIRLLQLSAATARSAGHAEEGRARAEHAIALADGLPTQDPALSVLALAEAAECALALSDASEAALEFRRAADITGLPDSIRGALLRREATSLSSIGRYDDARRALEQVLLGGDLTAGDAARVRLDIAGIAQQAGQSDRYALVERARIACQGLPDADLHADIALLQAAVSGEQGQFGDALRFTELARLSALEADAPVAYLAACLSEAQFLEALDAVHDEVYAVLARGRTALENLAGPQISEAAFGAALEQRRIAWGEAEWAAIVHRFEAGGDDAA